ncbi:hypothetical protein [Pseudarthrobacter siccitolerans]|uniref:hypothetical protein n=1 Tax=Pseudarthrobacter siccitolerans TaxID=861266 RepID=UPI0027B9552F|nr:hypothetical protein [Pseudarthrobacter siccitolerans]
MTLDIYADLFDEDLDAVADALDAVVSQMSVAKVLPREQERPVIPRKLAELRAFLFGGDGGI